MKRIGSLASMLLAAMVAIVPSVMGAPVPQMVAAGSSAQWKMACVGTFLDLAGPGAQHWTKKDKTPAGNFYVRLHDLRSSSIPDEGGNVWIVWDAAHTKIWAYISVDSIVGNRAFFASPRNQMVLDPLALTTPGQNLISAALLAGTSDAAAVPSDIFNALNNSSITAGFTDIRPEDAKFGQCRVVSPLNVVNYTGLGYGSSCTQLVGTPILSALSSAKATPVAFNISGTDPFTGQPVKVSTTIPSGAAPILFVINRTNMSGLGAPGVFKNVALADIRTIYWGAECDTNAFHAPGAPPNVPITVINREPLSGTFNTTEFTNFRLTADGHKKTMELNVNPATDNPLNKPCTSVGGVAGTRKRAQGTGEVISRGVLAIPDSIGFAFFSYGNVSPLAGTSQFGYLTLDGVDPIQTSYTNGNLPLCTEPCPITPGTSFPNVRNGTYRSWSVLRVVTDAAGTNLTNTQAVIKGIQAKVNSNVPDFIPFVAQADGDPGLQYYRSHFLQSGVSPSNGLPNGVGTEKGGDMGGCIEHNGAPPGILGCRQ